MLRHMIYLVTSPWRLYYPVEVQNKQLVNMAREVNEDATGGF